MLNAVALVAGRTTRINYVTVRVDPGMTGRHLPSQDWRARTDLQTNHLSSVSPGPSLSHIFDITLYLSRLRFIRLPPRLTASTL